MASYQLLVNTPSLSFSISIDYSIRSYVT